jgi:SAM-dependent methyltransferase
VGCSPLQRKMFFMGFANRVRHRIYTGYCERKFGVSTGGRTTEYSALEYEYLLWALPAIPFPAEDVVFVDYGAGKGRALAAAAARQFRKVIGVEISGELVEIARGNLARLKRRRAGGVEIHHADAAEFAVPDEANVFFFFNPFGGETLARVVERIEQSSLAHPRELFVIYFNHGRFDECIATRPWLRKVHETSFCGFYRLASAR